MIEPAYLWMPPRVGSYGDEAIDLAAEADWLLDDEQKVAVDAMLSFGPGGKWAALEAAIIEARQNGKTARVLQPVTLFDLFLLEPDRIVWTAHLFRTARDSFDDFCLAIEKAPVLSRRVKKISYSHGEEYIELHNTAKLEFLARSSGGGRGLGGKRVVMDEALILSAGSMGALMPTLSARPNPQINYGSSACKETSDHLYNLMRRGRAKQSKSLIWVEFCAEGGWESPPCVLGKKCPHTYGTQGCALDDETLWLPANHSLGVRRANGSGLTYEYIRAEREALPPKEFGRERLGWHEIVLTGSGPIDEKSWMDLVDIKSEMVDPVALCIEVRNDRSSTTISAAGRRADGLLHVEVIKSAPGVAWAVDAAVKLNDRFTPCVIVIDDKSEAASLLPDLKAAGLKVRDRDPEKKPGEGEVVVTTWAADMARACGSLFDAITDSKTVRHLNQPDLNNSVRGAVWRSLGDAKAWSRKEAHTDPSQLISVTLALHGLLTYGPKKEAAVPLVTWR